MTDCNEGRRRQPLQQPKVSASDLLERYIDQFEASHRRQPQQEKSLLEAESPVRPQLQTLGNNADDAWALLCGSGGGGNIKGGAGGGRPGRSEHVSVRTRCILQNVDRKLGFQQPCYSTPENLDLRSLWPSMHEHLERRWRHKLAAQHEAQQERRRQREAAVKVASSRADLYRHNRSRGCPSGRQIRSAASLTDPCGSGKSRKDAKEAAGNVPSDEDDIQAQGVSDGEKSDAASTPRARTESDSSTDCPEEAVGCASKRHYWGGSDSGVGLSVGVSDTVAMATVGAAAEAAGTEEGRKEPGMAQSLSPDHRVESSDGSEADRLEVVAEKEDEADPVSHHWRSFDERMRSYRCVLEAHELSAQLRLSLEAACVATARPLKALSAVEKGEIRDRLARLQGPMREKEEEEERRRQRRLELRRQRGEQVEERITTERLSNLMVDARSLLLECQDADEEPVDRQSGLSQSPSQELERLSESESH